MVLPCQFSSNWLGYRLSFKLALHELWKMLPELFRVCHKIETN
jgi:hypothetical protein